MNSDRVALVLSRLAVRQEHADSVHEALLYALYVMRRQFRVPVETTTDRARHNRARQPGKDGAL